MTTLATASLTAGGVALIAVAVRDIFETLLHPEGRGPIARGVMGAVWRLCCISRSPPACCLRPGPSGCSW